MLVQMCMCQFLIGNVRRYIDAYSGNKTCWCQFLIGNVRHQEMKPVVVDAANATGCQFLIGNVRLFGKY